MSSPVTNTWRARLRKFKEDRAGGVMIMFAGGAMALTLIAAGAIELHRRNLATSQLQSAADAAALAGKKRQVQAKATMSLAASQAQGRNTAMQVFANTVGTSKSFSGPVHATYTWNADGSFTVLSEPDYDVVFASLLPSSISRLKVRATVDFANSLPTEVALVLDTTASMFNKDARPETRFTLMRNAAKSFTHQLFNAAQTTGDNNLVRISVVPWATSVNVLGAAPGAADFTGDAPVVSIADKGSQVAVSSPMGRGGTVSGTGGGAFAPVGWRGCINGSTESGAFDDTKPATFQALRVQPAPVYNITVNEGPLKPTAVTSCTCTNSVNVPCGPGSGTQGFQRQIEKAIPRVHSAAFLFDRNVDRQGSPAIEKAQCTSCLSESCSTSTQSLPDCTTPTSTYTVPYCYYWSDYGRRNSYFQNNLNCTGQWDGCYETGKGPKPDLAQPACVSDPNEPAAVSGAVAWCPAYYQPESKAWAGLVDGFSPPIAGPNLNCPSPMLGLSGNRRQVIEYIDRLSPVPGGTHADVGLRWGLRTLTKNNGWPAFFGLTKNPEPFGSGAQKVMVMITDGENEEAVNYPGYWGCSQIDTDHPGCTGAPNAATLDSRMQSWCDAIRTNYNVTIFAIAVNFGNAAAVGRLQACAGNNANVFSVDAADLSRVLDGIATRVMAMRLTQ